MFGQTAIFIKKLINYRKNHIQTALIFQNQVQENNNSNAQNPPVLNNQRWNDNVCSIMEYFLLIISISIMFLMQNKNFMKRFVFDGLNLNELEEFQLKTSYSQLILNVFIPIIMYAKNNKLFKHVQTEFFG